jgi:hypothetical protein
MFSIEYDRLEINRVFEDALALWKRLAETGSEKRELVDEFPVIKKCECLCPFCEYTKNFDSDYIDNGGTSYLSTIQCNKCPINWQEIDVLKRLKGILSDHDYREFLNRIKNNASKTDQTNTTFCECEGSPYMYWSVEEAEMKKILAGMVCELIENAIWRRNGDIATGTKKQAILKSYVLWAWLAQSGSLLKEDYPLFDSLNFAKDISSCPLCTYTYIIDKYFAELKNMCIACPMYGRWTNDKSYPPGKCTGEGAMYEEWSLTALSLPLHLKNKYGAKTEVSVKDAKIVAGNIANKLWQLYIEQP